jgi:hypothetical protein
MRISIYLAVAQWALLFALGFLVVVMYRQLGRHLIPAKAQANGELGPAVGSQAAEFEYVRADDQKVRHFTPGDGQAALVAFVDPTCPACEELVASLDEADANADLAEVRVLLLVSDPPSYLQISEPFRKTRFEVGRVLADSTLEAYRASATPLLVSVDNIGIVRSAGPARQLAEVRRFAHACQLPSPGGVMLPVVAAEPTKNSEEIKMITTDKGVTRS